MKYYMLGLFERRGSVAHAVDKVKEQGLGNS
jgi:hypothetical protein